MMICYYECNFCLYKWQPLHSGEECPSCRKHKEAIVARANSCSLFGALRPDIDDLIAGDSVRLRAIPSMPQDSDL